MFLKNESRTIHCSGALVHPEFVISAAHCFTKKDIHNPPWNNITVAFGLDDVSLINAAYLALVIQKRKIATVHFHDGYTFPQAYRDVVLVKLKKPVILTAQVYPICLPEVVDPKPNSMRNHLVTLVGYGPDLRKKNEEKATKLNLINQKILPRRFCAFKHNHKLADDFKVSLKLKSTFPRLFRDGLICAGLRSDSKEGTCNRD